MKRIAVVLALTVALVATLLPGTGQADPGLAIGLSTLDCQILIQFPATNAQPKSKCGGWARGAMVATGSKPGLVVFDDNGNFMPKTPLIGQECQNPNTCIDNFQIDVANYNQSCIAIGQPPLIGMAMGRAHVWGHYVPGGQLVQVNFGFQYTHIGAAFIATLNSVSAKNEASKTKKDPDGTGFGVAYGLFLPKATETLGVCGDPRQNHFDLVGSATWVANP